MTAEDQSDFERFKKMLDRLGKPMVMSAESETSEIIRRRLFEWDERAFTAEGKVILNKDAQDVCKTYADWVIEHRELLPSWFNVDGAREQFATTYPFHPAVISVFERKWQSLPRFQQTRGVLRLLALWVSRAYQQGFKGAHKDAIIETVIEALSQACYYLSVERNRYRFGLRENLNKRFADRRATIQPKDLEEQIRTSIQKEFATGAGIERVQFPEKSSEVPDHPAVTLVVLSP